ncbi:Nectin-4 [Dissostichus eleginoides]|uniref:Nectin-4 n=1 Tax=Dissostichus eleginoides TaxID=100907 RepID=A0AAD9EUS6_DISEL|nr:Nectin-4 [Dissostichus eleginoides]
MCLRGLLLVSGLFLSSWALTPEECQPLVTPRSLADPSMMYNKPNFLAGYNDNKVFRAILKGTQSSLVEISASPLSPQEVFMSHLNRMKGVCMHSTVNTTIDGDTATTSFQTKDVSDCTAEYSPHGVAGNQLSRGDTSKAPFKNTRSTLVVLFYVHVFPALANVTSKFHILPSSDSILVMSINSTASHFKKLLQMTQIDLEDAVDEISFHALYLLGRETTLSDSDMEEFKKQASCLGFSGEPHYIYNPENAFCTEEESIKMEF